MPTAPSASRPKVHLRTRKTVARTVYAVVRRQPPIATERGIRQRTAIKGFIGGKVCTLTAPKTEITACAAVTHFIQEGPDVSAKTPCKRMRPAFAKECAVR